MTDKPIPSLRLSDLFGALETQHRREQDATLRTAAEVAAKRVLEQRHYDQRPLTEADRATYLRLISTAFEHREREVMLTSFPSDYCADQGRHINHELPGWEDQLPGYARQIYDFWNNDLRLGGFGLNARVLNFSEGGIPLDIGLFVSWPDVLR